MRKLLCFLLALTLCVGFVPAAALAADEEPIPAAEGTLEEPVEVEEAIEETAAEPDNEPVKDEETAGEDADETDEPLAKDGEPVEEDAEEPVGNEEAAEETNEEPEITTGIEATAVLDGSISSYTTITIGGSSVTSSLTSSTTSRFYKFTLASSGAVTLKIRSPIERFYLTVYDGEQDKVWSTGPVADSTGIISETYTLHLTKGTYYIGFSVWGSNYGGFILETSFSSANESFAEAQGGSNNSISAANTISVRGTYNGQLALNDEKDFYKFTLATAGAVTFVVTSDIEQFYLALFDADGNKLDSDGLQIGSLGEILETYTFHLTKGTYYISISCWNSVYGNYKFVTTFANAGETFPESQGGSDNTISAANSISMGKEYTGQIALNDEKDFYKFTLNGADTVMFLLSSEMDWVQITVFDSSGNTVFSNAQSANSGTGLNEKLYEKSLAAGTYYVSVSLYAHSYGTYTLRVGSVNAAKLMVSSATALQGNTVTLTVYMTNNPGVQAMVVTPEYNTTYLTLTSVANGAIFDSLTKGTNLVFDDADETTATGVLCKMTFAVKGSAPDGEYAVDLIARECTDGDGESLNLQASGGTITIGSILYGDVNGDGKVNTSDLALLRKYLAGYDYSTGTSTVTVYDGADANGDGKVNASDLALLRKYLANYDYSTGTSSVTLGP